MNEFHLAYLSLGSNIQPEINLVRAIRLLAEQGTVKKISSAWESRSVGADGPNYLNACVLYVTALTEMELKEQLTRPIESQLGRKRTANKFAPRTMDIDTTIFDDRSCADKFWEQAFVVVPLAEICPEFRNPLTQETASETATRLRRNFWMQPRREVLNQFIGNNPAA
jgi:2-amino-4-hydroxy-6-hydroxymethyldihydropteridine diphosphokinase